MPFKDIIVPILEVAEDEPALKAAEIVGELADAHLSAVFLEIEPDPIATADGYICGEVWDRIAQDLAKAAHDTAAALERRPWSRRISMSELRTRPSVMGEDFAKIARCADLTVFRRLGKTDDNAIRSELFQAALFNSGRPVLLAPPGWYGSIGQRVLVAWSGKRESARALADAAPFVETAASVTVATVADRIDTGHGSAQAVAGHLARHGVKADVRVASPSAKDEGQILLEIAKSVDADLIVMGGYGHARAAEFVFGGVTRELSRTSPIPLLLSH
ncbi:MAG TPA: universal stress protein [Vitreimonas sp.]|jgi:nucleotide-binding universal stress UspA family protein|nr:universal stress protein [Vitreimonas sp.]